VKHALSFLREFVRDPVCIGSVAPSGPSLARLTVQAADIQPDHVIVELGAGTGPMTAEIVARHQANPLLCLEPKPRLAQALRARFPSVQIEEEYVQQLPSLLERWGHQGVDRVVSSLPWAIWPDEMQAECFDAIQQSLRPGAKMVTFQYLHSQVLPAAKKFRRTLDQRFGRVTKTQVAWANVPPAFVFLCEDAR